MATLFSLNDGNLTDPNVFGQTLPSGDFFDGTFNLNVTQSFADPSVNVNNILSNGSSISAIAVNVNYRSTTPAGTLTMLLSSGGSFVTETYAISSFTSYDDRNNLVSNVSQNWQILKLSTPFASTPGNRIRLDFATSDVNQLAFVGMLTAYDSSKSRVGTFNGTFTQTDSPFLSSPSETIYRFSTSQANFSAYNDAIFGIGDFTVELWFKLNSITTYVPLILKGTGYNGNPYHPHDWFLYLHASKIYFTRYADVDIATLNFSYTPVINTWTHIAACRKNDQFTIYVNGVSLGSFNNATNFFNSTNRGIQLGTGVLGNVAHYVDGSITNARVIAGKALYFNNFPVPSSPLLLDSGPAIGYYKSPSSPTYVPEITPFSGVNAEDGSLSFNGTSDFFNISNPPTFNSEDFAIEMWVNLNTFSVTQAIMQGVWQNATQLAIWHHVSWPNKISVWSWGGFSSTTPFLISTTSLITNRWYHVAVTRSGNVFRLFINGIQESTHTGAMTINQPLTQIGRYVDGAGNPNFYLNGYLSNVRIVRGTPIYTSNFTVPTAPLARVSNTALLFKAPYSPLSRTGIDYSLTPFTSGNAEPSSLYFNGTSDYLTLSASPNYNFTSGTFTIEAWVRFDDLNNHVIASNYSTTTTGWTFQYIASRLKFNAAGNPDHIVSSTTAILANTWYHVAVSGSPGSYRMFIDGAQVGNTYTGATSLAGGALYIGTFTAPTNYHKGYISNLRIVNGTALYTANFTPPTAPLTNIANTVYLLKSPYDQFGMLSIQSPFGVGTDSSVRFNGTSDYLRFPKNTLGSNNFTVELWCYITASTAQQQIIGQWSGAVNAGTLSWTIVTSNDTNRFLRFLVSTNGNAVLFDQVTTTSLPLNTWSHIAFTRDTGGVYRIFLNGVLCGNGTNTNNSALADASNDITIGATSNVTQFFNGFVSNARIVNGTALYTSNFTPSTSPLSAVAGTVFLMKDAYNTQFPTSYTTPFLLGSYGNLNKGLITNTSFSLLTSSSTTNLIGTTTLVGSPVLSSASPFGVGVDSSIQTLSSTAMPYVNFNTTLTTTSGAIFGTNDFTIEFFANYSSVVGQSDHYFVNYAITTFGTGSIYYGRHPGFSGRVAFFAFDLNPSAAILVDPNPVTANTWLHYALVRSGNRFDLYRNGVSVANATYTGSVNSINPEAAFTGWFRLTNACVSNYRIVNGTAVYKSNFAVPTAPLSNILNTTVLYKAPYNNTFLYADPIINLHVGGSLKGLTTEPRTITADSIKIDDLYIHNQGKLTFPTTKEARVLVEGSRGLQVTSDGTLEVGNALSPVSKDITHNIVLTKSIEVHNGGNLTIYGAYEVPYTRLATPSLSTARTFTVIDAVSTNWNVGDTLVFIPNTTQPTSYDVLTLSSFDSNLTFKTTTSAVFAHTVLEHVPSVANLTRNVKIHSPAVPSSGLIRAMDAARVNINHAEFKCSDVVLRTKVNSNGIVAVNGCALSGTGTQALLSPFPTEFAAIFNGTTSTVLGTENNTDFSVPDGTDFTLECFIKQSKDSTTYRGIFAVRRLNVSSNSHWSFVLYPLANNSVKFAWYVSNTEFSVTSPANMIKSNVWHHLAVVGRGGTIFLYIDGKLQDSAAKSSWNFETTSLPIIGKYPNLSFATVVSEMFDGKISNLRFVKGAAMYSGDFIPPSSPLTEITDNGATTAILTFQDSSIIDNSYRKGALTLNAVSTELDSPFGRNLTNINVINNVLFKTNYGISLNGISVNNSNNILTNNLLLNSTVAGIYMNDALKGNIIVGNNIAVGPSLYGCYLENNTTGYSLTGIINYNNTYGMFVNKSHLGRIDSIINTHNTFAGMYVDGNIPQLARTVFTNITASNNRTLGFVVSGNTNNLFSPITLNINRLVANNNLSGGFEAYCISGNLSSLELNHNGLYGMKTSIGNAPLTINGITALMPNVSSVSAAIGILSGVNYFPIVIKNANLGKTVATSTFGSAIMLDSTKFLEFVVMNSTLSGGTRDFDIRATRNLLEGSYLVNNTNVGPFPLGAGINRFNYQTDVFKTAGFAFTNVNNATGYNVAYFAAGNRLGDYTITYNVDETTSPSERLTPQSATVKLRSGSKFVALSAGEFVTISVFVRKSRLDTNGVAYNGNPPRLILKRNGAMGIDKDIVLTQLSGSSNRFAKLTGLTPIVTDTGVLEFYVDCDGTQGWINIDNWTTK